MNFEVIGNAFYKDGKKQSLFPVRYIIFEICRIYEMIFLLKWKKWDLTALNRILHGICTGRTPTNSAIQQASKEEFDLDIIFDDTDWCRPYHTLLNFENPCMYAQRTWRKNLPSCCVECFWYGQRGCGLQSVPNIWTSFQIMIQ